VASQPLQSLSWKLSLPQRTCDARAGSGPAFAAGQRAYLRFPDFSGRHAPSALYAGRAPDFTGLYQFNITVPNVAAGTAVPLTFTIGGQAGTQTLSLAVQNWCSDVVDVRKMHNSPLLQTDVFE
jgi:hypothetical protein